METSSNHPPGRAFDGLSIDELGALESLAHLALYLTLSKTDPQRLQDCLQILFPLLEELGKFKGAAEQTRVPRGEPITKQPQQ